MRVVCIYCVYVLCVRLCAWLVVAHWCGRLSGHNQLYDFCEMLRLSLKQMVFCICTAYTGCRPRKAASSSISEG